LTLEATILNDSLRMRRVQYIPLADLEPGGRCADAGVKIGGAAHWAICVAPAGEGKAAAT
jgi:hypothetical protein